MVAILRGYPVWRSSSVRVIIAKSQNNRGWGYFCFFEMR